MVAQNVTLGSLSLVCFVALQTGIPVLAGAPIRLSKAPTNHICWYSGAHCPPGGQAGQVELGARWQRQVELPPGGPLHARWARQPGGPGGQVGSKSQVGHRPGGCQVAFAPGAPGGSPARWQYICLYLLLTRSPTTKPCPKCFMPGGPPARWAPQRQVGYGNSI